jgi:SAM-dependent methyltransferase
VGRDVYELPPRPVPPGQAAVTRRSLLRLGLTPRARHDIAYDAIADRVRSAWERPGSEPLLRGLDPVAEVLAGLAGVGPDSRVVDVGAGDGNVALVCAARGAEVAACDLAPAMVQRGRQRCGASVRWAVADVESLPFADRSFDVALSAFGASLAPRPTLAARELCRIVRPGGVVAVAAWVPRGLPGDIFGLAERIDPLPEGVPTAAEWGRQAAVRERLGGLLEDLELRTRSVRLRFSDADAAFEALSFWAALEPARLPALRPHFARSLAACNNSATAVEIDARYLIALGRRPAPGE